MTAPTRRGIVYIAEELRDVAVPGPTRFYGHWESQDPNTLLEQGPGWDEIEDAVTWGRERAPVVLLRLGETEPQVHYSAGDEEPRGIPPPGGIHSWPPGGRSDPESPPPG